MKFHMDFLNFYKGSSIKDVRAKLTTPLSLSALAQPLPLSVQIISKNQGFFAPKSATSASEEPHPSLCAKCPC